VDEMFNSSLASKSFALVACLTLLISAFGCNTGSIVSPDKIGDSIVTDPSFIRILPTPKGSSPLLRTEGSSSLVSAESGGRVSNGWVILDFPAGALEKDTEISISMSDPNVLVVDLEPHGIQFKKPVTMTFNLNGTDAAGLADDACLLWFNDEMGWWEKLDTESPQDSQCQTLLEHFSKYADSIGG
jgi:hypothetical protein